MCHGLWSLVKRQREESTPSTRPLFSNIHPPCLLLCVCVCLSEVALYRGPAPESGTSDARRRVTSPAEKQKFSSPRPALISRACQLHDDHWRCDVSLLFVLPSLAGPHPPACRARMTFEPRVVVHSVSTCWENGQFSFSTSSQLFYFIFCI